MHRVGSIMLMLLLAAGAGAQSTPAGAAAGSQTSATARTLIALENDWARGVVRRDTAMFMRLLDPRFVYTEDATVMGKDDVIRSIRDGDRIESASNSDMTVHDFGGTAVVTGILRMRGRAASGPFDHRYRFTDTWMRRNGTWRIIAAQDYLMPAR
jgi:ketosteroid isomerase-like protein